MIKKRTQLPKLPVPHNELAARLLRHVTMETCGCWRWTSCLSRHGYGKFTYRPEGYHGAKAHRVSYEAFVGPIPKGHGVLHKCDNTWCINPSHLFTGTQLANMRDASDKGRVLRGSNNPVSKLTECQISMIRSDNRLQRQIAEDYGVTQSLISYVKSGHVWSHAT